MVAFALRKSTAAMRSAASGLGYIRRVYHQGQIVERRLLPKRPLNAPLGHGDRTGEFRFLRRRLCLWATSETARINGSIGNPEKSAPGTLHSFEAQEMSIDGSVGDRRYPETASITFSAGPGDEAHGLLASITQNNPDVYASRQWEPDK